MTNAADDKLELLFPTVVQVSQVEGATELNAGLLRAIYAIKEKQPNTKPNSWSCSVYTTISSSLELLDLEEFKEFREIVQAKVTRYATALKFDVAKHPLRLNECWINVYSKQHSQEIHLHQNSVFSGIYYVKAPAGCAPTLVYSPMADVMLEPPTVQNTPLNTGLSSFDAIEGRMLVFRSCVRHSVLPSVIDEDRVTIAFNVTM